MADNKIFGYKRIFGFVLPDWVDEGLIRTIVTFLLSTVVMLFVLIFVIWPKFATIADIKRNLTEKQTQLDSLKSSKAGFDKLNEDIPEATQNLILQSIPQTYSPENAIFMLRNLSNETGVSIVSYTLPSGVLFDSEKPTLSKSGDKDNMVNFINYPIKLSVLAPVDSLLSFIKRVESSLPFGVVSDLGMQEVSKLSKSTSTDKSVKMELEIKYFQTVLKQVDISKITQFTNQEMKLVDEIAGFSQFTQGSDSAGTATIINNSGNLFGF